MLVPVTYVATRLWTIRHPGPVVATGEGSSLDSDMGTVLLIGAISFSVAIVGQVLLSLQTSRLEQQLALMQSQLDG